MRAATNIKSWNEWPTRTHKDIKTFAQPRNKDWEGSDMLTAFTYIKDCYKENGNFYFFPSFSLFSEGRLKTLA